MFRDVHLGSGSQIPIFIFLPSRIPDKVVQKDTGSRIRNTGKNFGIRTPSPDPKGRFQIFKIKIPDHPTFLVKQTKEKP
jgi:hypothetical protein